MIPVTFAFAIYTMQWVLAAEGVVPPKYLTGTPIEIGIKFALLPILAMVLQVMITG